MYGNIYTSGNTADPVVLREAVKGGNLKKEDKAKITKLIKKVEKEEEKAKLPEPSVKSDWSTCDTQPILVGMSPEHLIEM